MIDYSLRKNLKENAPEVLEILKNYGIDVSKYEKLAQEISEKEKAKKTKKIERQPLSEEQKELNRQARKQRKEEKARRAESMRFLDTEVKAESALIQINILKEQEERRENSLIEILNIANSIAPGEIEKKEKTLAELNEQERQNRELKIIRAKQEFMQYYAENWFLLLLDMISKTQSCGLNSAIQKAEKAEKVLTPEQKKKRKKYARKYNRKFRETHREYLREYYKKYRQKQRLKAVNNSVKTT